MTVSEYEAQPTERMATGVEGLDTVLKGGLLKGGVYTFIGEPGTGKTILGNQIALYRAAQGDKVVYLTLLAERHSRMISHMRGLTFFDPALIGDRLLYFSGYPALEEGGLAGLLGLLREVLHEQRATLLIVDGFITVKDFAETPLAFKRFLHELHTLVDMLECTAILLTQPDGGGPHPEHTLVDGLVLLARRRAGLRAIRDLEVLKTRGAAHLEGIHIFTITSDGVTVYPRTEALYGEGGAVVAASAARVATGVPRLDAMLDGGVVGGSTTMLLGAAGSGKTLLGLTFLAEGARNGQPGVYFGFYESPERLIAKAEHIGLPLRSYVEQGLLQIIWQPAVEQLLDPLAARVIQATEASAAQRLFLDGIDGFRQAAAFQERLNPYFTALTQALRARNLTTFVSAETESLFGLTIESSHQAISTVAENIILLRYVEMGARLYRLISVLKCRDSAHDSSIRELQVTSGGVQIAETFQSAEAILTGVARPATQPPSSP